MATMEELESALIKADAAGNADDARVFANEIRRLRAQGQAMPQQTTIEEPALRQRPPAQGFFEKGGAVNKFAEGVVRGDVQRGVRQGLGQAGLGLAQLVTEGGFAGPVKRLMGYPAAAATQQLGQVADQRQQGFDASQAGQSSAGQFGQMVGQTAPALVVPGGAPTMAGRLGLAAAGGAAMGAAAPVTSGDFYAEKAKQVGTMAGVNALGAGVIGEPLRALARGGSGAIDDATRALYEQAKARGIPLGIPQVAKNGLVRTTADQLARLPLSGGSKRAKFRQEAFNAQVAKTIGEKAKAITSDVFDAARTRIGNVFETLSERNSLPVTPQLLRRLGAIREEVNQSQGPETAKAVEYWLERLMSKAGDRGVIPGRAYKSFDSDIGRLAAAAGGEKGHFLGQIRDFVRLEMDRSISPADQAAWSQARKQWAALKTIEPLVAKSPDGNIPPAQLMGVVTAKKADKSRMARGGGGALGELAQIGQRFMKSAPDSGTADRAVVNAGIYGSTGVGMGAGYFVDPSVPLVAGGALVGNNLLQRGLNSKIATDYYVNGAPKLLRRPLEAGARVSGPVADATYLEMLKKKQR